MNVICISTTILSAGRQTSRTCVTSARCRPCIKDHRQILVVFETKRQGKDRGYREATTVRLSIRHLTQHIMQYTGRTARGHDTSQSRRIRGEREREGREGPPRGWARGEKERGEEERKANEEGEDPARASGRNLGPRVPKHGLVSLLGLHGQRSSSSTSHLRVLNLLPRESWPRRYRPHY